MRAFSSALELVGLLAIVAGFALIDWRYAVIAAGFLTILVGFVLDPPRRRE